MRLFHVSETPDIERFEPRAPAGAAVGGAPVVWAIDEEHLVNYLLPRDCPRVAYHLFGRPTAEVIRRLFRPEGPFWVVAIETTWLARAEQTPLYVYELPDERFRCTDANAGYHISNEAVAPTGVTRVDRPADAIRARAAELRVLDSLWTLHDVVIASCSHFSMIRMRNALPRSSSSLP